MADAKTPPKKTAAAAKAPKAAAAAPAAPASKSAVADEHVAHGYRRKMVGKVIKAKMMKTVVVECVSARRDPLYGKYVRTRARFKAHDEKNEFKVGARVEIMEHRPISKDKRWKVIKLISRAVEE